MKRLLLFTTVLLPLIFSSCCNDAYVQEILEDSTMHEQGLRNANETESLVYVYIDYNRALNNTMSLGGHFWDKTMSEWAFALLVGVLLLIMLMVKRIHFLYRFLDGKPDILLNTACIAGISMTAMSMLDLEIKTFWFIPVLIALVGIGCSVLAFRFPYSTAWLTSSWQKYVRYLYLLLFAVFVVLCLTNAEVLAPSVY